MGRLNRALSAAAFAGAVAVTAWPSSAFAQQSVARPASVRQPEFRTVSLILGGAINGVVSDERGGPLPGAMVSVLGTTMAMTVTDASGRFSLDKLPAGEYTLRAHLAGFAASRRENVRVGANAAALYRLQLHRLDAPAGTTGFPAEPLTARPIIAAGFGLPQVIAAEPGESAGDDHSHTDTAWRLRHATRSILKDSANAVVVEDNDAEIPAESIFGRTKGTGAALATSLFADLPFSGEVNLLTTGAFAPGGLFSGDALPRGVAYLAIGAPTGRGLDAARRDERRGSRVVDRGRLVRLRGAGRSTRTISGSPTARRNTRGGTRWRSRR